MAVRLTAITAVGQCSTSSGWETKQSLSCRRTHVPLSNAPGALVCRSEPEAELASVPYHLLEKMDDVNFYLCLRLILALTLS